jgi:hypothetical protein
MLLKRIYKLAAVVTGAAIVFTSCSKDDGAIPKDVNIQDVPAVSTNFDAGNTADTIAISNKAAFQGKFKVWVYFTGATPPAKVDIMVRKNAKLANVKLFKADITTLPASFTITAAELETLFGAPVALKDTYDFAPDIYVGDKKYEAWPASGVTGSGQGVVGMSAVGFGELVRYTVK